MAAFTSILSSERLDVPRCIGKRSRSNSVSSYTSSTSSSAGGSSIFSNSHSGISVDSLSSCSSPASDKASPFTTSSATSDDERPSKSLRTNAQSSSALQQSGEEDVAALDTLEKQCTLNTSSISSVDSQSDSKETSPSPPSTTAGAGKSLFVDCLVDATVHVLNIIWNAPVHKSIAFLENVQNVPSSTKQEALLADSTCRCPVGSPMQGGIPIDLFVRETLRRSRTSCSTLQAALLYCKRVGYEVVRKRAETEGVSLTEDQRKTLDVGQRDYPSLSKSLDDATKATLPAGVSADPILCSRRTFLASIMVSSKFLQDRTFSNRAWSKISGLNVKELGIVERRLLSAMDFDLSVIDSEWQTWTRFLKGEWKVKVTSCQCNATGTSNVTTDVVATIKPIANLPVIFRKALERTASLNVDQVIDMEIPNPRGLDITSPNSTPSASYCDTSCNSTPMQEKRMSLTNTPTKASINNSTHKRESSLLTTALTNRMMESNTAAIHATVDTTPVQTAIPSTSSSSSSSSSTIEMSLPFPLRKGLAVRSISTRS